MEEVKKEELKEVVEVEAIETTTEADEKVEENKEEPGTLVFNTTAEAMQVDLAIRMKWLRDLEQTEFYVIDRFNDPRFLDIFKDSLYAYRNGVILIDRFFFKDKCETIKRNAIVFDEEAEKTYKEFLEFSANIPDITKLSEEEQIKANEKIKEYQAKLSHVTTNVKEIEVMAYRSPIDPDNPFNLSPVKNLTDDIIDKLAAKYTNFAFNFLDTMSFRIAPNTPMQIVGMQTQDYLDLLIVV